MRGDWGRRAWFVCLFLGTTSSGIFLVVKPGEHCNSYICLMVAAAALAKPRSELLARDPGRELGSLVVAWALLCPRQ